jgi:hypothetical protein
MKILKGLALAACAVLLFAAIGPATKADLWDKKTIVTFGDSVEVPGMILPAGTYIFKLADSNADRHLVQIWTGDGMELITTIQAVPDYRLDITGHSVFAMDERPGDSPMALKEWFYPGDNVGQEFVYHYRPQPQYNYEPGNAYESGNSYQEHYYNYPPDSSPQQDYNQPTPDNSPDHNP